MTGLVGAAPMLERMLEEELHAADIDAALDEEQQIRELCAPADSAEAGDLDAAAAAIAELDTERIRKVIQVLTMRFHLRNKAEQLEIARKNREREHGATRDNPRPESIAESVAEIARGGASLDELLATLARLDVQPTLTAHPTEARRRAVLRKQGRIADCIDRLNDPRRTPGERDADECALRRVLLELAVTDEVRSTRLDATDEVRNGLHFLAGSIWNTVPELYVDLRRAIGQHYGASDFDLPTVLRYRSWIGGDRDGNPRVTPEVTRSALATHRQAAIDLYLAEIEKLRQDLTVSTRRREASPELLAANEAGPDIDTRHLRFEPYRVRMMQIARRLTESRENPAAYTAADLERDLVVVRDSLMGTGLKRLTEHGPLNKLIRRVRTFGLHLAALDIRQHSEVHGAAVAELLRVAGVTDDYQGFDEAGKLEILRAELASPRPLTRDAEGLAEQTAMVLETMNVAAEAVRTNPGSIGTFIVSMTHEVSDLLEMLLLAKEAGLYHPHGDGPSIDVAPLFETIDDLDRAESLLDELFSDPVYRAHVERRGNMQEVMLGYSDSNKDGGYWVANWILQRAQREISLACERAGVQARLFHGRGGTIGRGGGRANRAILAAPRESRTGRIRFTEQGEVISFRYALPAIARRHLEQIVSAMVTATHHAQTGGPDAPESAAEVMEKVSQTSMNAYRALIDDEAFWPWYMQTTPVKHISNLPLASRPVLRNPGSADFDKLRAIPWVFAWTQIRANAPGWYGAGTGLAEAIDADPALADRFSAWTDDWPFFNAVVSNAEQELARSRLLIAERYAEAAGFGQGDGVLERIRAEHERTVGLILGFTGSSSLLDRRPVIRDLIHARNPDTDALHLCQIELMRRARESDPEDPTLQAALLASLNGIAAAMQSTG